MTNRLVINKNKMVLSKVGFDATDPSLLEGNKLFDSDWLFSSNIVEIGLYLDNATPRFEVPPQNLIRWDEATDWNNVNVINFTPLDYIPTVMLISLSDPRYWDTHGMVLLGAEPLIDNPSDYYRTGNITVTNSQIIIPRIRSPQWWYKESFIYLIMAM